MKVYVTDDFDKFMNKAKVSDNILRRCANELANGLQTYGKSIS